MKRRLNLIKLRKETLGLSLKELSEQIGVSVSYQNSVEICRKNGSVEYWKKLYKFYPFDDLWELEKVFDVEEGEKK